MIARPVLRYDISPFLSYVEDSTGMTVPETNVRALRDSITERLAMLGVSAESYLELIERNAGERELFLNAATINETYFFREHRQFMVILKHIMPELAAAGGEILLWSATCSSGEEALSLAMIAGELPEAQSRYRVFASDINTDSLRRLEEGAYSGNSLRGDGSMFMPLVRRHFHRSGKTWRAGEDLLSRVVPVHLNISRPPFHGIPDKINLALFRNTLIYMKPDAKMNALHAITRTIAPGGYLFLSSTEIAHMSHDDLVLREIDGVYFFRKKDYSAPPSSRHAATEAITAPSGPEAKEHTFDAGAVLRSAAAISRGESPPGDAGDRDLVMAEMLLYALHFINAMKFGTAKRILSIIEKQFRGEITAYLSGFTEMLAGRPGRARARFLEALRLNGEFWPARFYLATVLKDAGDYKHALREFQACRDGISGTGGEANLRYRFLMENFSERYFLELCTHWIETLKNK